MDRQKNPFTPTFGIVPPYLAGRERLLDALSDAFENGLGDPNLCTLFVGPRGSGKTALLSCIGDVAREAGWLVVDAVVDEGLLDDVLQHTRQAATTLMGSSPEHKLTTVSIGSVIGLQWENTTPEEMNWRMRMEDILNVVTEHGSGLLLTVDEVRVDVKELVHLVSTYQLFVRQGLNVALVMAGLPANVTKLVDDPRVSFLRRAKQRVLGPINDAEVSRAFRNTVQDSGKTIDEEALAIATKATQGFPYMMQLVGYGMWAEAKNSETIMAEHAQRGVQAAMEDFRLSVLDRTWGEMSKGDRAFAMAMIPEEQGSTLASVAQRMGRGKNYASTYKKRLERLGLISTRSDGTFDFDIPMMRSYMSEKMP